MNYKIDEIEINNFDEFGFNLSKKIIFVPENIEVTKNKDEFIFTDTLTDLNKILKNENTVFEILGGENKLQRSRKNADLYLPAIFISYAVLSENPNLVSIGLNIISNFATDFFKRNFVSKQNDVNKVNIDIFAETTETKSTKKTVKKITYNGDIEGLKELPKIIKSLN